MSNIDTKQYQETVHIPKYRMVEVILNSPDLSTHDLRLYIYLLSQLDGYNHRTRENSRTKQVDPRNFKRVDYDVVSDELLISKKKVKESMKRLEKLGVLERGDSMTCKKGWRFTF